MKNGKNLTRSFKPPHYAWLIPYLTVKSSEKSIAFYEKAFGFHKGNCVIDPDGNIQHAEMIYQESVVIMFSPEGSWEGVCKTPAHSGIHVPINLYVYSPDVDNLYQKAKLSGAQIDQEPTNMFWGDRITQLSDLDGYRWTFATNVSEFDPSKIPHTTGKK